MDLLTELALLRRTIHGLHAGARTGEAALEALIHTLEPGLAAAEAGTGHLHVWPTRGRPRMCVLAWPVVQAWHGSPAQFVFVEYLPGDAEAAAHACQALDALPVLPHFDLHLDVHLTEARAHLLAHGPPATFGIDSVTLMGRPAEALARLPTPPPLPAGLRIAPIEPAHHAAVVELERSFFTAHPEFCWFGANPRWLQNVLKTLEESRPGLREVVLLGDTVLGCWGTDFEFDTPLWGHKAGMLVVLHPTLQGQGLVKLAYQRMFQAQVAAGIELFRGGTSQPAVLGLGLKMGRWPHSAWIRPKAKTFFDPAYFEEALSRAGTPATPTRA